MASLDIRVGGVASGRPSSPISVFLTLPSSSMGHNHSLRSNFRAPNLQRGCERAAAGSGVRVLEANTAGNISQVTSSRLGNTQGRVP